MQCEIFPPTFFPTRTREALTSLPLPLFPLSNQKRQLAAFVFVWSRTMGRLTNQQRTDVLVRANCAARSTLRGEELKQLKRKKGKNKNSFSDKSGNA
ncbi:hypothetical protein CDAR_394331 [Caerostris darwini]|uniref:Uncharacterized protein n=1 Tax=Caerostris darwini TaxID=1538125 RepID=A0AAV4RH67_9ARAC|nr:hypothetical protein CDAR_394331 [Caerostris darwini]